MSKYIDDDKLRKIVNNFDDMDIDLDNMLLEDEHQFSDRHQARINQLLNDNVDTKTYQEYPISFYRCSIFCKAATCLVIVVLFGLSILETSPHLDYVDRFLVYMLQGLI